MSSATIVRGRRDSGQRKSIPAPLGRLWFDQGALRALKLEHAADASPVRSLGDLLQRIHPEDRGSVAHLADWAGREAGATARLWCRLARADGDWVPVLARFVAPEGALQVEIELDDAASARRAEAQIRQVLEEADQAAVVDVGGTIAYTNHALAHMLGYASLADLRAGGQKDHIHPEDRDMVRARRSMRLAGQEAPDAYEFRMQRKDGTTIWVACHTSVVTWNGRPASLAWLIDITDRKRMEATLTRAEKLFGTIFDSSPAMLTLSRLDDGRFIDVNQSFLRVLGYRREEVIGRKEREIGIFLQPAVQEKLAAGVADWELVAPVNTRSGEVLQLAFSSQVIRFADLDMLLTVAHDVTARLQNEEKLRQSQHAAEVANRAKSEFLAHMSHELRTPLNAIIGFSDIIAEQIYGEVAVPKYLEYARDVRSSGEHLLQIINDLLDLSKLEAGKQELHESVFAVPGAIDRAVRLVQGRAASAGLTLGIDLAPGLPQLRADERLLIQMLTNLLSNAVKFTPAGGKVEVKASVDGEGCLCLTVSDNGIGMTEEGIGIALTPFGQIENAFARRHQGTGLGLPLVRALAELHGGDLNVQSKLGRGTTVSIRLPAARTVAA